MSAHYQLSGPEAGSIAARGRLLLRRRVITPFQHALLETALWGARRPGSATFIASLKDLARRAGQGRTTIAEGITRLEELGLLQRIRRRVRVAWIGGGQASRQIANAYLLISPDTESAGRPGRNQSPDLILVAEAPIAAQRAARSGRGLSGATATGRRGIEREVRPGNELGFASGPSTRRPSCWSLPKFWGRSG